MGVLLLLIPLSVPIAIAGVRMLKRRMATSRPDVPAPAVPSTAPLMDRLTGAPFQLGTDRVISGLRQGTHRGRSYAAFHYRYSGLDEKRPPYRFTVVTVMTPVTVPELEITVDTIGGGASDVELESSAFNDVFQVITDNRKFAYDVLDPRMMEWLLADPRARYTPLNFGNQDLFTYTVGEHGDDVQAKLLDFVCDFLDRVPAHAWTR